jgi:hypothetical protein
MTISNFKYFEYYPLTDNKDPLYGLYEPVTDCFLTVLGSIDIITQLRYIVSSRYHTHICQLNHASNYTIKIIDNEVCTNWSLTNKTDIPISATFQNRKNIIVEELCNTTRTDNDIVLDEQQWVLFCTHWIKFLSQQKLNNVELLSYSYTGADNFINDFLQIENIGPDIKNTMSPDVKRSILKLLYLSRLDIDGTEAAIKNIIITK